MTSQVKIVSLGDKGHIESIGFPNNCCVTQTILLERSDPDTTGFIHLTFDDLDIPPGLLFRVSIL